MNEPIPVLPSRSAVGQWSVDRYVRLLRPWLVTVGLIVLVVTIWSPNRLAMTVLQVLTCALVGRSVARRGARNIETATAGTIGGAVLGAMSGLGQFIRQPSLYAAVNVLFETLLLGLIGAMVAVGVGLFFRKKFLPN